MFKERVFSISADLYRWLLFLYPAVHRREYGPWMVQLFRDLSREAYHRAQWPGLLSLWLRLVKDLLTSAAAEHLNELGLTGLRDQPVQPLPWPKVVLATLPGLVLLVLRLGNRYRTFCLSEEPGWAACAVLEPGLARLTTVLDPAAGYVTEEVALLLVCLALLLASFLRVRPLAAWSFPALGLLLPTLPVVVAGLFYDPSSGPPPPAYTLLVNRLWPGLLWAGIIAIVVRQRACLRLTKIGWLLLVLLVALTPLVLLMGAFLLFPVALGLLLVRRSGLPAGLVVAAGLFWIVDGIFDPNYGLLLWSSNYLAEGIVSVLPLLAFLLIPPIWLLRARSIWGQVWGLILPPFIGLVGGEIIRSLVLHNTPAAYSPGTWLLRGAGALEFIIALLLATLLYLQLRRGFKSAGKEA